jgi:hypothetical protein
MLLDDKLREASRRAEKVLLGCLTGNLINITITTILYSLAYTFGLALPKAAWYLTLYIQFSGIAGMAQSFAIGSYASCINLHMARSLRTVNQLSLLGSIGMQTIGYQFNSTSDPITPNSSSYYHQSSHLQSSLVCWIVVRKLVHLHHSTALVCPNTRSYELDFAVRSRMNSPVAKAFSIDKDKTSLYLQSIHPR